MNDRQPDLRRPVTGPYRQSRWAAALEYVFGLVAKGTMVLAVLIMVAISIITGDAGGIGSMPWPRTRKGRWRLLLVPALSVAIVAATLYFMKRGGGHLAGS
ncbi:hypothetical protein DF118_14870 [Burkholderia stagnalis]|nr:hypothetical protein WT95_25605 [Burkholderia stagnalis]RQQ29414.1 hypothetical protein DF163_15805 [Burkholderia stagnalis]RQQ34391.1 hypothetical protein DF149_11755 [Burkholderia stagnalis]RQQ50036.1 hypothetical protein DF162_13045 [Burkholderia stagnalis]RQX98374.1 hypothetical protein DF119_17105 [Burkholderia stagnalis]